MDREMKIMKSETEGAGGREGGRVVKNINSADKSFGGGSVLLGRFPQRIPSIPFFPHCRM